MWTVAASRSVAALRSEADAYCGEGGEEELGAVPACQAPTFAWLPDSTICYSEPRKADVRVCSPQGAVLGSAAVHFELSQESTESDGIDDFFSTRLRAAVLSPTGSFLAMQSSQDLLILAAPSCSVHLQLSLASSGHGELDRIGVRVTSVWWCPDSQCILTVTHAAAICSLPRRCRQQVVSPALTRPRLEVLAWATPGVFVTMPALSTEPGQGPPGHTLAVLDPDKAAISPAGKIVPCRLRAEVCSPDKVPGSCQGLRQGRGADHARQVWARDSPPDPSWQGMFGVPGQDSSALLCQGIADSHLHFR